MVKRIDITRAMEEALALVARTEQIFTVGADAYAILELPKLALADATIAAVRAADARQQKRLAKLPTKARGSFTGVVAIAMRPKRRRA